MNIEPNQLIAWLNDGANIVTAVSAATGLSAATILAFALALGETVLKKFVKWFIIILIISAVAYAWSQGMLDEIISPIKAMISM